MLALGIKPKIDPELVPRLIIATLDGLALHQEVDPLDPAASPELLQAVQLMVLSLFEV